MTGLASAFSPERPFLLLGCGKMGGALLDGWLAHGLDPKAAIVLDPAPADPLKALAVERGLTLLASGPYGGNTPRVILLAVKPQMMAQALPSVASAKDGGTLYLSIAAGTPISFFEAELGPRTPVIRMMPNTPAAVGEGVSALIANAACKDDDRALATALGESVGKTVWLDSEDQMDAVTGVSGSGPAYVFHLIEALTAAAEAEGLAPELALTLARQTVIGAAKLAAESPESAETLRINVTSPGGTTAAGLERLMNPDSGLVSLMRKTVHAASERSRELRS